MALCLLDDYNKLQSIKMYLSKKRQSTFQNDLLYTMLKKQMLNNIMGPVSWTAICQN
jgi:hypothetical protein